MGLRSRVVSRSAIRGSVNSARLTLQTMRLGVTLAKRRLYRVFEPMIQWAVFEAYATSKEEARRMVIDGEGEIEFSFTDEPMPDSRRPVIVELWRDDEGRIQYAPVDHEVGGQEHG